MEVLELFERGGIVMYVIALASVVGLAVFLELARTLDVPTCDVTYVFYAAEEIAAVTEAQRSGDSALLLAVPTADPSDPAVGATIDGLGDLGGATGSVLGKGFSELAMTGKAAAMGAHTSQVAQFPGFADHASADYDGGTGQLFGEIGYAAAWQGIDVEPFGDLQRP